MLHGRILQHRGIMRCAEQRNARQSRVRLQRDILTLALVVPGFVWPITEMQGINMNDSPSARNSRIGFHVITALHNYTDFTRSMEVMFCHSAILHHDDASQQPGFQTGYASPTVHWRTKYILSSGDHWVRRCVRTESIPKFKTRNYLVHRPLRSYPRGRLSDLKVQCTQA
jgi:hypothetical protein